MTVADYLLAVVSVTVVVGSAVISGRQLARTLVPSTSRVPNGNRVPGTGRALPACASAVCAVWIIVAEAELLGTVHALDRPALVVLAVVVALLTTRFLGRVGPMPLRPLGPLSTVGAITAVGLAIVAGQVLLAIHNAGTTGITFSDALDYHLTQAAHFATTHSTTGLIHIKPGDPSPFYPFNDELLHAVGMVLVGRDTASLLIGPIEIGLVILAVYAIGDELGSGWTAVAAFAPLLVIFGREDASAGNDWASMWPLLAAVAVLVAGTRTGKLSPRAAALAGLALGLAAGTKVTILIPAVMLGLVAVVLAESRVRVAIAVLLGGLAGGGYWYLRDTIQTGSPLPTEHIPLLPRVPISANTVAFTVAHYLGNPQIWRLFFLPGLRFFLGDGWPVVVLLAVVGVVGVVRPGTSRLLRLLGVVTVICFVGYLVTPGGALGLPGYPALFAVNLRYALPALGLGLILFAAVAGTIAPTIMALVSVGLVAVTTTAAFAWAGTTVRGPAVAAAIGLILVAGACLVWDRATRRSAPRLWSRKLVTLGAVGLAAVAVVAGYPLQQRYLHDRYHSTSTNELALFNTLPSGSGLRIGVVGEAEQYPFLGPQWQNTVHDLGAVEPKHAFELLTSCSAFLDAVTVGRYDLVVVENYAGQLPTAMTWLEHDPAATLTFRNPVGAVFRVQAAPADRTVHNGCVG